MCTHQIREKKKMTCKGLRRNKTQAKWKMNEWNSRPKERTESILVCISYHELWNTHDKSQIQIIGNFAFCVQRWPAYDDDIGDAPKEGYTTSFRVAKPTVHAGNNNANKLLGGFYLNVSNKQIEIFGEPSNHTQRIIARCHHGSIQLKRWPWEEGQSGTTSSNTRARRALLFPSCCRSTRRRRKSRSLSVFSKKKWNFIRCVSVKDVSHYVYCTLRSLDSIVINFTKHL
jgi:hypothetical protein